MRYGTACGITVALWAFSSTGVATPKVAATTVRAPLVGSLATPAPGQGHIGFYGTDLGFTMVARDANGNKQLRIVFGDSWANSQALSIGGIIGASDDCQGLICLQSAGCPSGLPFFPNGAAVDAYIDKSKSPVGGLSWQRQAPPVLFRTNAFGNVAPLPVYRGGVSGTLLNMGPLRTPSAVFGNGLLGGAAGAFAIFERSAFLQCSGGLVPGCIDGFKCDGTLGSLAGDMSENAVPCVLGTLGCAPIASGGFCVDATSSVYSGTDHRIAAVDRLEVGNADPNLYEIYYSQDWYSNKFINPSARVVNDFAPARANGSTLNDFNPPDDATTGRETVFLWGRPSFYAAGGKASVYFAYVNHVPSYDANGAFGWAPQYYTRTVNGVAQFSPDQNQAAPLVLGTTTTDSVDIVNQLSVSWVDPIKQWVMVYGGDGWDVVAGVYGPVTHAPGGPIKIRFASEPWGPWSAPQTLLAAGDPATGTLQYGSHGILHSAACGSDCAPDEPFWHNVPGAPSSPYGVLYGASIIDPWTTAVSAPSGAAANIYWTVSTFDPYEVVLMRSTIDASSP